ncbi:MAG: c-type cytochrome biogenesis protein CcmI [Rhodospirillales bacterium]|nr:c-type cytochrome biogenesis protein CcmI [Rhodospirillales bacterium]
MTAFWIAAAAATLLVLAFLVLPLARKAKGGALPQRADFDLTVYKDQLSEVDRDLERGVLNENQALAARTEIERRMLAAAADGDKDAAAITPANARLTGALIIAILVVVPLGAAGLYFTVGNPGLADRPLSERTAERTQQADPAVREAQLRAMIQDIKARLEKDPKDPRNWNILGKAYEMLGDQKNAIGAFEKLVEVTDRHPDALLILAEALFADAGQVVTPDALALFKEARTQDPTNPMTYYYAALERQQVDDLQGAMNEYLGLLSVSPSNGPWVPDIQGRIKALAGELGVEAPVAHMLPPADLAPAAEASAPGPSAAQVEQAQEMSPEEQQAMIRTMVERLAAKMKENPDDLAGWQRLAQAYTVLGDKTGLAEAEAQIKRLGGQ